MPKVSAKLSIVALAFAFMAAAAWYVSRPYSGVESVPPAARPLREVVVGTPPPRAPRSAQEALAQGRTAETSPLLRAAPERPALRPVQPAPDAIAPLPETKQLLAAEHTGAQDLQIVYRLLDHYRQLFGGFPSGEDNAAMVNALTGNNPERVALIERTNPAINAQGELVDRWGRPVFFHQQSRDAVEIRSAGPDREMYTSDDLLERSPSLSVPEEGETQ